MLFLADMGINPKSGFVIHYTLDKIPAFSNVEFKFFNLTFRTTKNQGMLMKICNDGCSEMMDLKMNANGKSKTSVVLFTLGLHTFLSR